MSEELKPCPFCGKLPNSVILPNDEVHVYDANSHGCLMSAGWSTPELWNIRPLEDALLAKLKMAKEALRFYANAIDENELAVETLQKLEEK